MRYSVVIEKEEAEKHPEYGEMLFTVLVNMIVFYFVLKKFLQNNFSLFANLFQVNAPCTVKSVTAIVDWYRIDRPEPFVADILTVCVSVLTVILLIASLRLYPSLA